MNHWIDRALNADVAPAAAAVRVAAVEEAGRQADELIGIGPLPGTPERDAEQGTPSPAQRALAWQLVQFRIDLEAGMDPLGNLVGLRRHGATWEVIAKAAGITRQSAHERWAKRVTAVLDRYGTGELGGPVADDERDLVR